AYPELNCTGLVSYERLSGDTLVMREEITAGRCRPTGTMVMVLVGSDSLSWDYEEGEVTSTLARI
ncbi:MAG: hypothetical protein R2704_00130, partial [Microthrixaceae bacterium]